MGDVLSTVGRACRFGFIPGGFIPAVFIPVLILLCSCQPADTVPGGGRLSTGSGNGNNSTSTGNGNGNNNPGPFSVGGTLQNLGGAIVLQNNNTDDLTLIQNGAFTFNTQLPDATAYSVTVKTQPAGQNCTVQNGNGVINGDDITDVLIACTNVGTSVFSVGGAVTGSTGTMKLQNNGGDDITVNGNSAFVFPTLLANGSPYVVTMVQQPAKHTCTMVNHTNTIQGANVTNVNVNCTKTPRTWTEPADLSEGISMMSGKHATKPAVTMDDNDDAIIVWSQTNKSTLPNDDYRIFKSELRSGIWSHPQSFGAAFSTVPALGPNPGGSSWPAVAMANNGDAVVLWSHELDKSTNDHNVFMRERRNGNWTPAPTTRNALGPSSNYLHQYIDVDMNNVGDAVIAWYASKSTAQAILRLEYFSASRVWSTRPAPAISTLPKAGWPSVGMDNNGDAAIVWGVGTSASVPYQAARISDKRMGSWQVPLNISAGTTRASTPSMAMSNGGTLVGWCEEDFPGAGTWHVRIVEHRDGSWVSWGAAATKISPQSSIACSTPAMAINDNGDSVVAYYQRFNGLDKIFMSTYDSATATWTHAANMNSHINPNSLGAVSADVAIGNDGTAVVVYSQQDSSGEYSIFKSVRQNGVWTHPSGPDDDISPEGKTANSARVAVNNSGNVVIVWKQGDISTENHIYMSEYR